MLRRAALRCTALRCACCAVLFDTACWCSATCPCLGTRANCHHAPAHSVVAARRGGLCSNGAHGRICASAATWRRGDRACSASPGAHAWRWRWRRRRRIRLCWGHGERHGVPSLHPAATWSADIVYAIHACTALHASTLTGCNQRANGVLCLPLQLELTDGWYWVRASCDEQLTQLVRKGRICQGGWGSGLAAVGSLHSRCRTVFVQLLSCRRGAVCLCQLACKASAPCCTDAK